MLADVLDMLFGCSHKNYTFPRTVRKGTRNVSGAARVTGTYVVCLDCGREFPYDLTRMKVLSANTQAEAAPLADATTFVKAA